MALFLEPLIDFSIPGVRFTQDHDISATVCVLVAQLSPHDYGIVVVKLVDALWCGNPPEVLSSVLIGPDTLKLEFFESSHTVVLFPDGQKAYSLVFDERINFWSFVSSVSEAKIKVITRLLDLGDLFREVLSTVPSKPSSLAAAEASTADAAVATEQ